MAQIKEGEEARAGIDGAAPRMGELHVHQLREAAEEMRCELLKGLLIGVVAGADLAAEVIDRVVAAVENTEVAFGINGGPCVVEAVVQISQPDHFIPADGLSLLSG